jgi:HK97 gp10 family phage protein
MSGITGDLDLSKWTARAHDIVSKAAATAVKNKADQVVATAKELAPVLSGALRDNIAAYQKEGAAGHYAIVKVTTKEIPYGYMVHFGTEKMTGRPFLYQAVERNSAGFKDEIKANIATEAEEAVE